MYVDQSLKMRHKTSLIISGLAPSNLQSDVSLFLTLRAAELHILPNVVFTKCLGQPEIGRIQPLFIVLKQAEQAKEVLGVAKLLRLSTNDVKTDVIQLSRQAGSR